MKGRPYDQLLSRDHKLLPALPLATALARLDIIDLDLRDAFSTFTFGLGLYLGFWLVPAPRRFGAASRFSFGKKGLSG